MISENALLKSSMPGVCLPVLSQTSLFQKQLTSTGWKVDDREHEQVNRSHFETICSRQPLDSSSTDHNTKTNTVDKRRLTFKIIHNNTAGLQV